MKLIYIIGPYRAADSWQRQCNIHRAMQIGAQIVDARPNWFPVIPHANTANFDGIAPDEYFLVGTLEIMKRCDAVFLLPGWDKSHGSIIERGLAITINKEIYERIGDIPE